jgi:hypothetical protein
LSKKLMNVWPSCVRRLKKAKKSPGIMVINMLPCLGVVRILLGLERDGKTARGKKRKEKEGEEEKGGVG